MSKRKILFPAVFLAFSLLLQACIVNRFRVGDSRTDTESIEVGAAESVRADIRMGLGEIDISGGASELLNAVFTYNVDELEPQTSYEVSGSTGRLIVEHRDTEGLPIGNYDDVRSKWELRFNVDVPIDLTLSLGASLGDIDLRGLNLTNLDIEVGAGEGDLWLGDSPLRNMDIQMGAGNFRLDFTGGWENDLAAEITGGVGKLTIYLPSEVGVVVDVEMGIASVDISGLDKDGSRYTNEAYGTSDVTLRLDIQGGVGDIRLEVR